MTPQQLSFTFEDVPGDDRVKIDYDFLSGGFGHLKGFIKAKVAGVIGGNGEVIALSQLRPKVRAQINNILSGHNVEIEFGERSAKITKGNEDDAGEYYRI